MWCKDNANRRKYKMNSFFFIVVMRPILFLNVQRGCKLGLNANCEELFICEAPIILYIKKIK